jgi:hypothetical protein
LNKLESAWAWPARLAGFRFRRAYSSLILWVTAAYVVAGVLSLCAWLASRDFRFVENYFRVPGALLMVWLGTSELVFCRQVLREFPPRQPLHAAWFLIAFSAACGLCGALCVQILSTESAVNPLTYFAWWSRQAAQTLRDFGQTFGGTFRFVTLAAGLLRVLRVYRQSGFLSGLSIPDWSILSLVALYIGRETWDVIVALRGGTHFGITTILGWPVDPLLWILLAEAMIISRTVRRMGLGSIGRTFNAFSIGIFLVALGDISIWATNWGYLPWPWTAIGWYWWMPAAAAFALAPAYQLEAISQARDRRGVAD